MKSKLNILIAVFSLVSATVLRADPSHDHASKNAGPNGGRIVTSVEPCLEFFVTGDRKVQITFLDKEGKPVAPADQVVTAIGGDRSKPTRLVFSKEDGSLVSDKPLPEGNKIPLVLQVTVSPGAKPVNEKIMVNLSDCPECEHKEYACVCGH